MSPRLLLIWFCRLALANVYLFAAVPKIVDPAGFAKSISHYQMVPDPFINLMAIFLPWLELIAAQALLAGPLLRRGALWWLTAMTAVFSAAIASAMARGINIDCGCFSTSGEGMRTGWAHLALDLGLLAACAFLLRAEYGEPENAACAGAAAR